MEPASARQITNNIISIKEKVDFLKWHFTRIKQFSTQIRVIDSILRNMGRNPSLFNDEKEIRKMINFMLGLKNLIEKNQAELMHYIDRIFDSTQDEYEKKEMKKAKTETEKSRTRKKRVGLRRDIIYENIDSIIANLQVIRDIVLSFPEEKRDYPKVS